MEPPKPWRLEMFPRLLADHRHTLKSLKIGILSKGYSTINLLRFPNLEVLSLSHWTYRETPEAAVALLLAPRLHTFIWNFRMVDCDWGETWSDFGVEQKGWLLEFAERAYERKAALRRIEILYSPVLSIDWGGPETREELAVCVPPWDMMDEVRDKVRPLGIEIDYNRCWTREECLKKIELEEISRRRAKMFGDMASLRRLKPI
jgi:hypothetical protein